MNDERAQVGDQMEMLARMAEDCKSTDPNVAAAARLNLIVVQDFTAWLKEEIDRGTPMTATLRASVAAVMSCMGTALLTIPPTARPAAIEFLDELMADKWKLAQEVTREKQWTRPTEPANDPSARH